MRQPFPVLTKEEAGKLINHGDIVGFSGFTPAGAAKVIPLGIAQHAKEEHAAGRPFKIGVITGASTGDSLDGALARADAVAWRTPYQTNNDMRKAINSGKINFFDMHLSLLPQYIRYGFLGKLNCAIVEACNVTAEGEITLTTSIGISNTILHAAEKVLIEINEACPQSFYGFHDIYEPIDPPRRQEIPIFRPSDRIGSATVKIDPKKILGVVYNNELDQARDFAESDPLTMKIGQNVADFLVREMKMGRIPMDFLPIQSGVGNIANALLSALGDHPGIPVFDMYSEVIQDSVIAMIQKDQIRFVSGTSLTVTKPVVQEIYSNLDYYRSRMVLRPQEITNNPEIVRRLGIISINTAIEADIFGNINSTHIMGTNMMNGIGGSADFTRNAYISIFTCPSAAKKGAISAIVPLCSHMDHSEHSVQVIITEQGVADLRGKSPNERAKAIIQNCAHPDFKEELMGYLSKVKDGHTPQTLSNAFKMHEHFLKTGTMRNVDWNLKE
jgi:acetyl-CoA hydrolase